MARMAFLTHCTGIFLVSLKRCSYARIIVFSMQYVRGSHLEGGELGVNLNDYEMAKTVAVSDKVLFAQA